MPTTRLIGRDAQVAELVDAVDGGHGALIWGGAGVGKTAVAAEVAGRMVEAGAHVDWIVATAASRPMPFGALAPLFADDVAVELHPATVMAAISRRLHGIGGRHTPLLVVDDAHLLDEASAATLLAIVASGTARAVVTVRSGERAPDAVGALWKDGFLPAIVLSPFERTTTAELLRDVLGGDVATTTVELLWRHTRGNALYLREVAGAASAGGSLVDAGGVWVWQGQVEVPPRLAELLARRFVGLSPAGLDVLAALVLGEPLAADTLHGLAAPDAIDELEARGLVETIERDGRINYHFTHPLLASAAADQLTPTRRRRMADVLLAAPGAGVVDPVRAALWQLETVGPPAVDQLMAGAARVLLTQPDLARRFAARALTRSSDVAPALMLADADAELGELPAARRALGAAAGRAQRDEDRASVALAQAGLTMFGDRRPDISAAELEASGRELGVGCDAIESFQALVLLFSAQPAAALARAERILDRGAGGSAGLRAASVRVGALALVDRSREALPAARQLLAVVRAHPSPYVRGLAHIVHQVARFVAWEDQYAPPSDLTEGAWPSLDVSDEVGIDVGLVAHPLFAGARFLKEGDVIRALPLLREAVAQQSRGRCLLRSEAISLLITAHAATGDVNEAGRLLAQQPPDRVALYPGLELSSRAAVEAAAGRPGAVDLALAAAQEAIAAGGVVSAVAYLADAARYGGARPAAERLDRLGVSFEAAITQARAFAVRARASGDGRALLEAAEAHAAIRLTSSAGELAQLASAALGRDGPLTRRAELLASEMRRQLRLPSPHARAAAGLTRRELEVARLAAQGMSSPEISSVLFVSVRTVESHLASAYRKLDIRSRQRLRDALATLP